MDSTFPWEMKHLVLLVVLQVIICPVEVKAILSQIRLCESNAWKNSALEIKVWIDGLLKEDDRAFP